MNTSRVPYGTDEDHMLSVSKTLVLIRPLRDLERGFVLFPEINLRAIFGRPLRDSGRLFAPFPHDESRGQFRLSLRDTTVS